MERGTKEEWLASTPNLFAKIQEKTAIDNIQKFAKLADSMGLVVEVGFSGGKDSIVTYDLVKKSGIKHIAVFNYAFEDPAVVQFIKQNYPDVIISRKPKSYFQLIRERKMLPTQWVRFCCDYFKENSSNATIVGVRRSESYKRATRKTFQASSKFIKSHKDFDIFSIECREVYPGEIQLKPIVKWSIEDVWHYINENHLPYPSLYDEGMKRCGCMLCPLASLKANLFYFKKYPNLINVKKCFDSSMDLFIRKENRLYTAEQYLS